MVETTASNELDFCSLNSTLLISRMTNREVKKDYDGYLQYWSGTRNVNTNASCDSLFVGHCNSDQLLQHFNEFVDNLSFLLRI